LTLPAFAHQAWQMSYGERAALEGLVAQVSPELAVEIGTAEGGSLKRIAAHSREVHSFDLVAPVDEVSRLDNVTFHTGDSHRLLAEFLTATAEAGRFIDFILIDGDHSAEGVRQDIVDVLRSPAVTSAVIVLHDTLNPEVRDGIEAAGIAQHPKVALYELDLVPGYLARREPYRLQLWGGLGVIVVDASHRTKTSRVMRDDRFHELFRVLRPTVQVMSDLEARGTPLDGLDGPAVESALTREVAEARAQRDRLARRLQSIEGSRVWRLASRMLTLKRRMANGAR
jgi:hypothetical protein